MKMLKRYSILFYSILFWCVPLSAQNSSPLGRMFSPDTIISFDSVNRMAQNYLLTNPTDTRFAKKYARWEAFYRNKVDENGQFATANQKTLAALDEMPPVCEIGGDWKLIGPKFDYLSHQGMVTCVYRSLKGNNEVIYVGSNTGGAWKTTDGGEHWTCITDMLRIPGLGINAITGDPNNADVIYLATGNNSSSFDAYGIGVLKSIDGGANWVNINDLIWGPIWGPVVKKIVIAPSAPNIMYAITNKYLKPTVYKSIDDGNTWFSVFDINPDADMSGTSIGYSQEQFEDLAILPSNPHIIFVSSVHHGGLAKASIWSVDSRPTLANPVVNEIPIIDANSNPYNATCYRISICEHSSTQYDLFATGSVYSSNTPVSNDPYDIPFFKIHYDDIDPANPIITPITIASDLFKGQTANYGGFKYDLNHWGGVLELNNENPNIVYAGFRTLAKLTIDYNQASATNFNAITSMTEVIEYFPDGTLYSTHADARDLLIYQSTADGMGDALLIGTDGGVNKSTLGGIAGTWENLNHKDLSNDGLVISQLYDVSNPEPENPYIAGGAQDNGTLHFDGTQDWKHRAGGDGGVVLVDWEHPNIVFARSNWGINYSVNGGLNYTGNIPLSGGSNNGFPLYAMIQHPQNSNFYYVGMENRIYKITKTANGNGTFSFSSDHIHTFTGASITAINRLGISQSSPSSTPPIPNYLYISTTGNEGTSKNPFYRFEIKANGDLMTPVTFTNMATLNQDLFGQLNSFKKVTGIAFNPNNSKEIWISFSGFGSSDNGITLSRVYFTNDAGLTWQDKSLGLPLVPINNLLYQKGTIDVLYAATDVGVYRYNRELNIWQCFNQHLPVSMVTDLEIDYCKGTLLAATFGRGIFESPIAMEEIQDVTASTTWNTPMFSAGDIVIQSGVTITLTSTLNMAKDKYILIRPGAKLIVDGGKITNKCGEMWAGIIVEGDPAQHQFADVSGNYFQGYVECKNGATIEYAHSAIRLWNPITGDAMGGIVKATDSEFLNNRRSLEFMPYQNFDPNTSNIVRNAAYIRNCTFKIDDNYRRPDFYAHVSAWRVDGLRFEKCHFENAKTIGINVAQDLGTGIYTIDAGFSVKGHCDYSNVPAPGTNPPCPFEDIEPSVFKGLFYGIRADKEGSMNTYTVHGCRFENNIRGIESNGVDFPSILQNQFLVGGNPYEIASPAQPIHEGIIINTGTGYAIEENRMTDAPTSGAFRFTVGTRVNNSGKNENEVYKNNYQGLYVGNLSNGNNRYYNSSGSDGNIGLQFLCNTHAQNEYDIAITQNSQTYVSPSGQMILIDGIKATQKNVGSNPNGTITDKSAGNNFSQIALNPETDYYNHSPYLVKYFWHLGIGKPINYTQGQSQGNVTLTIDPYDILGVCQSKIKYGLGNDETLSEIANTEKKANYNAYELAYTNLLYNYEQMIDDGNTNALVQNIIQTWSDDAWTLRNQLLARSPYLSEEVITKAILQDILPQAMILEICLANPDVLRNGRFIEFLKTEISNPLPQYMIDILYAYQGTTSPRSVLENGLASYSYLMLSTGNELIRNILNESTGTNIDSLHRWLGILPTLSARYRLAESYFETGQNELAWQIFNDIPTEYALHSLDAVEYANYLNYLNLRIAVKNNNRTMSQLSNEELATLQSIRDASEMTSGVLANNTLCFYYGICKDYPAILPEIGNTQPRLAKPNLTTLLNDLQNQVEVHPNPVKEYAIFAYSLQNDNAQIVITDVTGKIIQRLNAYKARGEIVWDTHDIANGMYFYSVIIGDKSVATGKITVNN